MKSRWWAALALVGLLAFGLTVAAKADPLKIRIGFQTPPDKFLLMLAHRSDVAPHAGKSYELVPEHFAASSEEVTSMATGDLDIGNLAYSSFAIAIENAKMDDIRLVAESLRDGVPGYFSYQFRVRNNSGINRIEDLKGKIIGSNGIASATDMGSRLMLRRHGLEDKKDYAVVAAPLPNLLPMLLEGKIDLASIGPPNAFDPRLAQTHTLFTQADAFGVTQLSLYVARESWLQKNRAALSDFFEDMVRSTRWLIDPANHDAASKLFADYTKQPVASVAPYFMTKNDFYRDPDARPDVAATQRNIDAMRDLGFLKTHIEVARYTDMSFLDAAVKRVGAKPTGG